VDDWDIQRTQYEYGRKLCEPTFNCDGEVHGWYLDKSCCWVGKLKLSFVQITNDLRDSAHISEIHARLRRMADKLDDIHEGVKHTANKVDDIHNKLEDFEVILKRSGTRFVSDTLTRQEMPLKPEVFHGRDDMVEGIAQLLLHEETSRVCILGPGGMGKTSVALAVVELPLIKERFPGRNLVWVPCIQAVSATLLLEILYKQLRIPGGKQVTLDKIISELDTLKNPRLVLLDNLETPWNAPEGHQKVGDILRKLAMLSHVAMLVTMRGKYPPCNQAITWQSKDIEAIDEPASLRIYHDINLDSANDPDVARLLTALGRMPFAVTLMAKLGVESQSSAKDLLDAWSESGTDILSNNPEESMNRSICLSVESDLVKQNPNALLLLAILSLLPAGTTKENLRWWAPGLKPSMIPSAIATLSQAALVVENKRENSTSPVLFVVSVVQSFMKQHDRIAEDTRKRVHSSCCEYVLAHACRFDDPTFPTNSKALAAEDPNIQSILFDLPPSPLTVPPDKTMEALLAFAWYRCDTKPNVEIANLVVTAAEATGVVKYIASAVWCLGKTYAQVGDHYPSYKHLQEAYRLFNTFPLSEVELQRLGGQCGIDLMDTARFALPDYHDVLSLGRDVEMKCAALSDEVIHGRCLVLLGAALCRGEEQDEALRCLEQARIMLKAAESTYNLAEAYLVISWANYDKVELQAALDAAEEAWKLAELTDNSLIQAQISLNLGKLLFCLNRDTEAWKYIEITLTKASYAGNRLILAQVFEYMGYGYLLRGDYQNAYGAYEAAAEKYLGTVDSSMEKCRENMARIKRKEENPDMVIGFYRHGLDIAFISLFYPPVQAPPETSPLPVSNLPSINSNSKSHKNFVEARRVALHHAVVKALGSHRKGEKRKIL